jgi:L-fucose isomerase-like protein
MFRTSLLIVTLASGLSACTTPAPADETATPPTAMACNAEAAQSAIGKVATADVVEQARKDAGAATTRVIKPGQPVTMDYRGDRLNLDVDAANIVTGVRCG